MGIVEMEEVSRKSMLYDLLIVLSVMGGRERRATR